MNRDNVPAPSFCLKGLTIRFADNLKTVENGVF